MKTSIIIPTYRKTDLLQSVLSKLCTISATEIMAIDDGGYDKEIIREFNVKRIPREHKEYQLASNINLGVKEAQHNQIIKIDADCVPQGDNWAQKMIEPLKQGRIVCGRVEWERENGQIRKDVRFDYDTGKPSMQQNYPQRTWGGAVAFTRPDFEDVGGFSEVYDGAWGSEESDFGWKMHYAGKDIYFNFNACVKHLYHDKQEYRKDTEGIQENHKLAKDRKEKYKKESIETGGCLPSD